jgi:hypothetical protein
MSAFTYPARLPITPLPHPPAATSERSSARASSPVASPSPEVAQPDPDGSTS